MTEPQVVLRVTVPKGVDGQGVTVRGQIARIQSVDIPVRFLTPKSLATGATVELVVKEMSQDPDSDTPQKASERSCGQSLMVVSGANGQVKLQSLNTVHKYVPPKFATELKAPGLEENEAESSEEDQEDSFADEDAEAEEDELSAEEDE